MRINRTRRPRPLLFPGPTSRPFTRESVNRVFHHACRRAKITTHVYLIRCVTPGHPPAGAGDESPGDSDGLGHPSLRTTRRYTHVAATYLQETPTPLDRLPDLFAISESPGCGTHHAEILTIEGDSSRRRVAEAKPPCAGRRATLESDASARRLRSAGLLPLAHRSRLFLTDSAIKPRLTSPREVV